MKKTIIVIFLTLIAVATSTAIAGAIKTWSAGEVLTATDMSSNFNHIHNTMVGSHGARLKNADVASNAAIAHGKMATPGALPKAWLRLGNARCNTPTCTIVQQWPTGFFSSVTRTSTGVYVVTFAAGRANVSFLLLVAGVSTAGSAASCFGEPANINQANITCHEGVWGVPDDVVDARFDVILYDDND